ncbi:unnamed protein product [Symbiodinium sp. CCMP2592]|nr:unnamed protein product [Symbiodinium sp. CCMP2592]
MWRRRGGGAMDVEFRLAQQLHRCSASPCWGAVCWSLEPSIRRLPCADQPRPRFFHAEAVLRNPLRSGLGIMLTCEPPGGCSNVKEDVARDLGNPMVEEDSEADEFGLRIPWSDCSATHYSGVLPGFFLSSLDKECLTLQAVLRVWIAKEKHR